MLTSPTTRGYRRLDPEEMRDTARTARSLTSRGYLFCVFMTPSSQRLESPANPGRFIPSTSPTPGRNVLPYEKKLVRWSEFLLREP